MMPHGNKAQQTPWADFGAAQFLDIKCRKTGLAIATEMAGAVPHPPSPFFVSPNGGIGGLRISAMISGVTTCTLTN
jgi:hypothetical protein